jgi:AraC-like DNA-binding protein
VRDAGRAPLRLKETTHHPAEAPNCSRAAWAMNESGAAEPVARISFRTSDLDEARSSVGQSYYPHRLFRLTSRGSLDVAAQIYRLPKLVIGRLTWGNDVKVQCAGLQVAYHVNLPTSGYLDSECGQHQVRATPSLAAIYDPVGRTTLHHADASCRLLTVKMDRCTMESELAERLGRPLRAPIKFDGALDVTAGRGRSWLKLIEMLVNVLSIEDCLLGDAMVARHLENCIISGFLVAARHDHCDELSTSVSPCLPRHVKRAIDLLEGQPERPWTVTELARVVSVRARTLQEGFHQYVGTPPMTYLREVRLERAHKELVAADPMQTTVAAVACRWGFAHLGYFAGEYRKKYVVKPSDTLRHQA